jgi:hypothetical protein
VRRSVRRLTIASIASVDQCNKDRIGTVGTDWLSPSCLLPPTPLPEPVRHQWPKLLKTAPFIEDMAKHMDLTESHRDMQVRIFSELVERIGEGPYIGGLGHPTMLDLAVFPQLV